MKKSLLVVVIVSLNVNGWSQKGTPGSLFVNLGQAQTVSSFGTCYSNTVTDYFNLRVDGQSFRNSSVKLTDIAGRILYSSKLTSGSLQVDTRKFPKGYYIVEVNLGGTVKRMEIIRN